VGVKLVKKMETKINNKSGILAVILLISILIILSSCNLFLSLPRGRENLNDPAAQITAFTAVPSGDKSVVTMWNWRDSNWISSDERIDEIKIMHSIAGYPDINVPFVGQKYNNNSEWQYEWDSLIGGITHYFSLFAKDNDGNWYAPMRAKAKLPGDYFSSQLLTIQTLEVESTDPPTVTPAVAPVVTSTTLNGGFVLVLELGIPEGVFVESAFIDIGKITTTGPVRVSPVLREWDKSGTDFHTWEQLASDWEYYYVVDDKVSLVIDTANAANPSPIDITGIVRKTAISGPSEIIFKQENFTTHTVTINNMVDFLVVNYYTE
jgi:hypothetical protein